MGFSSRPRDQTWVSCIAKVDSLLSEPPIFFPRMYTLKSDFSKTKTSTCLQLSSLSFTNIPQSASMPTCPTHPAPGRTCVWTRRPGLFSHACAHTAADWKQGGPGQLSRLFKAFKHFKLYAPIKTNISEPVASISG